MQMATKKRCKVCGDGFTGPKEDKHCMNCKMIVFESESINLKESSSDEDIGEDIQDAHYFPRNFMRMPAQFGHPLTGYFQSGAMSMSNNDMFEERQSIDRFNRKSRNRTFRGMVPDPTFAHYHSSNSTPDTLNMPNSLEPKEISPILSHVPSAISDGWELCQICDKLLYNNDHSKCQKILYKSFQSDCENVYKNTNTQTDAIVEQQDIAFKKTLKNAQEKEKEEHTPNSTDDSTDDRADDRADDRTYDDANKNKDKDNHKNEPEMDSELDKLNSESKEQKRNRLSNAFSKLFGL